MKINIGIIKSIAKNFMIISKSLPRETLNYINNVSVAEYNKLEVTLKAAGFTVEQYFKNLADNSSDIEFVSTFTKMSAISAKIDLINCSTEMSEYEKIAELDKLIAIQIAERQAGFDELHKKRKFFLDATIKIISLAFFGATMLGNKNSLPTISKTINRITKK